MITPPKDKRTDELQSALLAARENENRWIRMFPEFSADCQEMEQWASTAKLRRLEVERIEALLAELSGPLSSPPLHASPPDRSEENC